MKIKIWNFPRVEDDMSEAPLEVMIDTRNLRIVRVDEKAIGIRDLEFIVRAVNSHADMLEALELSKDILADIHRLYGEQMEGTGSEGMIREHIELLTTLVAKAKGSAA